MLVYVGSKGKHLGEVVDHYKAYEIIRNDEEMKKRYDREFLNEADPLANTMKAFGFVLRNSEEAEMFLLRLGANKK